MGSVESSSLQALTVVLIILGVGLFGPVAVVLVSHRSVSRLYLGIQIFTVGLFGSATVPVVWATVWSWIPSDQLSTSVQLGLLQAGWPITAGALGFPFVLTHIAYSSAVWLVDDVKLRLRPWLNNPRVSRWLEEF